MVDQSRQGKTEVQLRRPLSIRCRLDLTVVTPTRLSLRTTCHTCHLMVLCYDKTLGDAMQCRLMQLTRLTRLTQRLAGPTLLTADWTKMR